MSSTNGVGSGNNATDFSFNANTSPRSSRSATVSRNAQTDTVEISSQSDKHSKKSGKHSKKTKVSDWEVLSKRGHTKRGLKRTGHFRLNLGSSPRIGDQFSIATRKGRKSKSHSARSTAPSADTVNLSNTKEARTVQTATKTNVAAQMSKPANTLALPANISFAGKNATASSSGLASAPAAGNLSLNIRPSGQLTDSSAGSSQNGSASTFKTTMQAPTLPTVSSTNANSQSGNGLLNAVGPPTQFTSDPSFGMLNNDNITGNRPEPINILAEADADPIFGTQNDNKSVLGLPREEPSTPAVRISNPDEESGVGAHSNPNSGSCQGAGTDKSIANHPKPVDTLAPVNDDPLAFPKPVKMTVSSRATRTTLPSS